MLTSRLLGYVYITFGLFCIVYFAREWLLQFMAIVIGISFIFKGFRLLAVDSAVYNYSQKYFNDQFR